MSPSLRNILGEDGEALTVLSLLEGPKKGAAAPPQGEMSLEQATERIAASAGEDARVVTVLSLCRESRDPDGDAFWSEHDVPVREACDLLRRQVGHGANPTVVLEWLSAEDQRRLEQQAAAPDDGPGPVREAVQRFVEALRRLFNAAGEDGQPLTILSLLVRQEPSDQR